MKKNKVKDTLLSIMCGAICGSVNGIFGGGGGMILVPMLTIFLKKEIKKAHATAILIILPITIASGVVYALFLDIKLKVFLPPVLGVIFGGVLGAFLLSKIKGKAVQIIFAILMMVSGVKLAGF